MKETYESLKMSVTEFDVEDVITTSDRNNAYINITNLDKPNIPVPQGI